LKNRYKRDSQQKKIRSQIETYNFLYQKTLRQNEAISSSLPEANNKLVVAS